MASTEKVKVILQAYPQLLDFIEVIIDVLEQVYQKGIEDGRTKNPYLKDTSEDNTLVVGEPSRSMPNPEP